MPRWRLTKFSTSSNSRSTGAFGGGRTSSPDSASVPGGVVSAPHCQARQRPSAPASCRARSIHGVSSSFRGVPGVADEDADTSSGGLRRRLPPAAEAWKHLVA